jgi:selenide,water dikinase
MEVCKGSALRARLDYSDLPFLSRARELADAGYITGASARNWDSLKDRVVFAPEFGAIEQALLTDPQTSGGLLVSCSPDTVTEVLSIFLQQGFTHVSVIGELVEGDVGIDVV